MIEILHFIFMDLYHYLGTLLIILIIKGSFKNIFTGIRAFTNKVKYAYKNREIKEKFDDKIKNQYSK